MYVYFALNYIIKLYCIHISMYIVFFLIGMEHYFPNSITQNSCLQRKTVKNR